MALEKVKKDEYVSILSSDGTFRLTVPEGTPESVKREYETSDGKKGTKNELVFERLRGKITKVAFFDGDFGRLLQLTITDSAGELVLSVNTSQNYGEDLMKKLPNIDLSQEVALSPYNFTDDKGKLRKGVSVVQSEKKIQNFFYDPVTGKNKNGFPEPTGDTSKYDKDDWKIYFTQARKFLVKYTEEHFVTEVKKAEETAESLTADLENGTGVDDILQ